ncbi:HIRA-interacting protein 3 isoform X3 [Perca flavescens]|uniref:HIRA-interacting protein 3 isoform X3 n=1 Tax=Perca flavescens TaxID=8167 RepID=UPI00106ED857|nr:HIRA-interacting protein 3 isoform X3 [Perca flavescens]
MKVSEKERAGIRRFVCAQLRDEPDLSKLTLGILKRLYLAHVGCESLSPEARNVMKQVVKEELLKMQEKDENGSELETLKPRNKRKRDKENDEVISGKEEEEEEEDDDESRAKKSRRQSTSSSESEDKEEGGTGSEEEAQIKSESEDAEEEGKNRKARINSEDSSDEEINKSKKKRNDCDDRPKEMVIKRANATKTGETRSSNTSQGKTPQSDEEKETDMDSKSQKSEKNNGNDSSDDSEEEEKVSVEKRDNDPESDSSSLPSIEDEKNSGKENSQDDKKKKTVKKEKSDRGQKQGDKAVVRLKHFISLCGLRPNYKKLLDGCRSVRSQVAVLKKELEELGVQGQPSVKKCKIVRMKREETQELAELDVSNIIATKELEDKDEGETGSEEEAQIESEDEEQEGKNSKRIKNGNRKPRINSEDSSDEKINKSKKKGNESDCDDRPKEMVIKRANATKTGETRSSNTSQPSSESDDENGTDTDSKSQKSEKNNGDDSEIEEKVSVEKRDNDPESDSSSLPSIEDEKNSGKENSQDDKKKKTVKKEKSDSGQKGDKAVVRLKRYISLCGLRPNYKKLLDGCRSVRSQVAVLKKELEELGVQGQPSVKKCKIVRMKREETQELAELDVSNIIATKGRPKRRAASAWQEKSEPPSSTYLHTLNSGSDSNEENDSHRGRRRTDWANLQGIISDDADSN